MASLSSLEQRVLVRQYGRWMWLLRFLPAHATHYLAGIELPPHERHWLKLYFSDYKENSVVASRGTSKCLRVGTKVVMADGALRSVEDVRVGEQVMGPDGAPRTVLDTTRGRGPMYRVEQSHGMTYEVNDAHILSLKWNSLHQDVCNIAVTAFHRSSPEMQRRLLGYRRQEDGRSYVTVTPVGEGEYAGFALDGDHLFLLEDGTVTHNSFTHSSLAAPLYALLHKNVSILSVSASGFRGGKLLMDDSERLVKGQLKSQQRPGPFVEASAATKNVIKRAVDYWSMVFDSNSMVTTVPTANADNMRGIRANRVNVDERNFFGSANQLGGDIIRGVIRPMMNVGSDFRKTAQGGDRNAIFQISTIDYTVRDWFPELEAMRRLAYREVEAQAALRAGELEEYERLMSEDEGALKTSSISYSRLDYTDLLIPEEVTDLEGVRWKVNYPLAPDLERDDVLKWIEGWQQKVYFTYPVDVKGLEDPLRNGTMDRELWLAEQRNVFIAAAGSVYPMELIQKASEKPIYRAGAIKGYDRLEDWMAPVLYECGDPCVIGLDYARQSDHSAVVVIRLGELAEGAFDPTLLSRDAQGRPRLGHTPWNQVIWAESWEKLTAPQFAELIRGLHARYNVLSLPGKQLRGMGLDQGGGGLMVRDELAKPSAPVLPSGEVDPDWVMPLRFYDPLDDSYAHYAAYDDPTAYWGGLELLKPTNFDNVDWTGASKGMMQAGKLFLGYVQPVSIWAAEKGLVNVRGEPDDANPEFRKWAVGYQGLRRLKSQLLRLQTKTSEAGVTRFVMPGDRNKEEGKKDLYSAFIYASYMARQHLQASTHRSSEVVSVPPISVVLGGERSQPESWFRRVGL